jgi:thymidylate synthase (FAD)
VTDIEFVTRPSATLVQSNATDEMVAMAAWVSFDRDSEERLQDTARMGGLINFLLREKHMSPFEHGSFTFKIDCPIFVAREFHRHRTMAYNEVSGRYTEMKPRFYVPGDSRPVVQQGKAGQYYFVEDQKGLKFAQDTIKVATHDAWIHYQFLLGEGVAKEVARMVLPTNLMTQFYATVNPRNLMHFLELRTSPQALYEIRQVAEDMEAVLKQQMPKTYAAWKNKDKIDGGEVVGHVAKDPVILSGPHFEMRQSTFTIDNNGVQRAFDRGRE